MHIVSLLPGKIHAATVQLLFESDQNRVSTEWLSAIQITTKQPSLDEHLGLAPSSPSVVDETLERGPDSKKDHPAKILRTAAMKHPNSTKHVHVKL